MYVALAATYASLAFWRYDIFRAGYDDGAFTQIVHGTFAGFSTTVEGGANHFLVHWSPVLILALPFLDLFGGTKGLAALQALLVAAVIFPVWAMARERFSKPVAFAVTLIAACYPPLSAQGVGDFHELAFAPVLTACLVLAIDRRAWRWAIAVTIALVCVKEDQFVGCAAAGIFVVLLARRDPVQRRYGWLMTGIALAFALLYFGVVRRAIDATFPYWSLHYYQWWWFPPTAAGFVPWNSLVRPLYLVAVLAPLAFAPLASRYLLFALPGFAEVLLSHEGITMALNTQYGATWCGYLLCAFVDGSSTIGRRSYAGLAALLVVAMAISIWTSVYQSPIAPGFALYRRPDARDDDRERILRSLPGDASVWSHDPIFAHLSMDPNASVTMNGQEYLVFDLDQDRTEYESPPIRELLTSGAYAIELQRDGLAILRKRAPGPHDAR